MNEIEQIKERLDIVEIVSSYLTLKRAGQNLKGLCPFHHEKSPSFMVNPERQIFRCFGCNEGGDIFTFIEKIEGVDFYNALKILADRAGVKLTSRSVKRGDKEYQADSKTIIFEINHLAAMLYHKILLDHPKASKARAYLHDRGLSDATIAEFEIGYAPDSWDFLIRFMESKRYKRADVFKAGMLVANNKGDYYDRFRGRIIFPINNVMGNCVGFTSRILIDDKQQAKYINSADSPIYHKGKILYGLDKAKMNIREKNMAVVVEGNMDVIACHQAGFKNVVASSGTAITEDQIRSLSRYASDIALAFDSDQAGEIAMKRAITTALKIDIMVKIIQIPAGFKDPDEAIKSDRKIWQMAAESARPAIEVWIDLLIRGRNINDIGERKKIAKEILPIIKSISSEMEKEHYLKYLAKKLSVSESSLLMDMSKTKSEEKIVVPYDQTIVPLNICQRIMALSWMDANLAELSASKIVSNDVRSNLSCEEGAIWQKLLERKFKNSDINENEKALLNRWAHQLSLDYEDASDDDLKNEMHYLLARLNQEKNEQIKEKYSKLINEAQESGNKEKLKELLQEFSRLLKE